MRQTHKPVTAEQSREANRGNEHQLCLLGQDEEERKHVRSVNVLASLQQ